MCLGDYLWEGSLDSWGDSALVLDSIIIIIQYYLIKNVWYFCFAEVESNRMRPSLFLLPFFPSELLRDAHPPLCFYYGCHLPTIPKQVLPSLRLNSAEALYPSPGHCSWLYLAPGASSSKGLPGYSTTNTHFSYLIRSSQLYCPQKVIFPS